MTTTRVPRRMPARVPGMVYFPGGTAPPRSPATDGTRVRPVTVRPFLIDRYPVSNARFAAFVTATGYRTVAERTPDRSWDPVDPLPVGPGSLVYHPGAGPADLCHPGRHWRWTPGADWRHPEGPDSTLHGRWQHPVVHVCLADAQAFAAWAGRMLPTEAQWEYAAGLGLAGAEYGWDTDRYPGGRGPAHCWQRDLAEAAPTPAGTDDLDLAGSIWEWTRDWYPGWPAVPQVITKGGSYRCPDARCRRYHPAARRPHRVDAGMSHLTFRCVLPG